MAFIQIVECSSSQPEELKKIDTEWRAATHQGRGRRRCPKP